MWPGEAPIEHVEESIITDRDADFVQFILDDVEQRRQAEEEFYAGPDPDTGELPD